MFKDFKKRSDTGNKPQNTPNSNEEFSPEGITRLPTEKDKQLEKELQNDAPILRKENYVTGMLDGHNESLFVLSCDYFKGKDRNCAIDYQLHPLTVNPSNICKRTAYIGRKTVHLSSEAAEEWRRQNIPDSPEQLWGQIEKSGNRNTSTPILAPEENKSDSMGTFIAGREYDYVGSTHGRECLYVDGCGRFKLEVTVTAKKPDTFGLQGDKPYIIREIVLLSEETADIWIRRTGFTGENTREYVRNFRAKYTNLDPAEDFDLPN